MSYSVDDHAAYDWLTLDEGETIEWTGKPHPYSLVPALVIGIPLLVILIGIPIILGAYLSRQNTNYVITNEALYVKTGVFSRDVQRIGYEKVQNTSYSQDFLGTQFGYGHVDISTAGGAGVEMRFRSVPEPKAVQERLNRHIRDATAETDEREDTAAVIDDILAELRAIREAIENSTEGGAPGPGGGESGESGAGSDTTKEPESPAESTDAADEQP